MSIWLLNILTWLTAAVVSYSAFVSAGHLTDTYRDERPHGLGFVAATALQLGMFVACLFFLVRAAISCYRYVAR